MSRARIAFGLLLSTVGAVTAVYGAGGARAILNGTGRWWPVILILLGVFGLLRMTTRPLAYAGPIFLMIAGGTLLAHSTGLLLRGRPELIGGIGVAFLGAAIVLVGSQRAGHGKGATLIARHMAIMHGRRLRHSSAHAPASLVAVVGYIEYDLRSVHDNPATLNLTLLAGHVDLLIRPNISIRVARSVAVCCRFDSSVAEQSTQEIGLSVIALGGVIRVIGT